jgi:hypothetical protein
VLARVVVGDRIFFVHGVPLFLWNVNDFLMIFVFVFGMDDALRKNEEERRRLIEGYMEYIVET